MPLNSLYTKPNGNVNVNKTELATMLCIYWRWQTTIQNTIINHCWILYEVNVVQHSELHSAKNCQKHGSIEGVEWCDSDA